MFCAEGDNAGDALELAKHMNDWLNIIDMEVR
jgi:NAD(P)H-hydrate repair Nnr-like enzyme with NAD(P)H-hydrate epimerase domain